MTDKFELAERSRAWIDGIRAHFKAKPLAATAMPELAEPAFKIL
jgi:hypothetical protein